MVSYIKVLDDNTYVFLFPFRDRRKKKFVNPANDDPKLKKIKTESGNWINASYNSGIYDKWKKRSKVEHQTDGGDDDDDFGGDGGDDMEVTTMQQQRNRSMENANRRGSKPKLTRAPRRELKTSEEIFKVRSKEKRKEGYQKWKTEDRAKKRGGASGGGRGRGGSRGRGASRGGGDGKTSSRGGGRGGGRGASRGSFGPSRGGSRGGRGDSRGGGRGGSRGGRGGGGRGRR